MCKINSVTERINLNGEDHIKHNNFMSHYERQQFSDNSNGQYRNSNPEKAERTVSNNLDAIKI